MSFHRCGFVGSMLSFLRDSLGAPSLSGKSRALLKMADQGVLGVPFPWVLCSTLKGLTWL